VNLYPELNETGFGDEGEVASLVGTPGLKPLVTLPTGPIRGEYTDTQGQLWAVAGNVLYQISSIWTYTAIGTLNTDSGPVSFKDNGSRLVVVDGPYGYQCSLTQGGAINYISSVTTDNGTNNGNGNFETGDTTGWSLANSVLQDGIPTTVAAFRGAYSQSSTGKTPSVNLSLSVTSSSPISGTYSGLLSSSSGSTAGDMLISNVFNINSVNKSSTADISFQYRVTAGSTNMDLSGTSSSSFAVFVYDVSNAEWIIPVGLYNITTASGIGTATATFSTSNSAQYQLALININATIGAYTLEVDNFYAGTETVNFNQITSPAFLGSNQVEFMDGYLIFIKPNSQQFYLSGLNSTTFDALDIGSAEANPDNLVGQMATQENLYLFGTRSLEVFYDSGSTFPFQRIQGAVIEIGCAAAFSISKLQNTIYWLGQDEEGRGVVYRIQGFEPQRISTHALEYVISQLGDVSSARSWTYQQNGHFFYCLNLPGAETTWVFDATTSLWHERAFLAHGKFSRHLADCHAYAYNTDVVGDYSSGTLYALDPGTFTDNGNTLVRERRSPHIAKNKKRMFHESFQLDMETGVGTDGTNQGNYPQAMLQWSDDAGHSWSNEHWAAIGPIGSRLTRVIWRRLGQARDRVYRVRISDPVKVTFIGAEIDVTEGAA